MLEEVASAITRAELKEIWCINQEANECPPELTLAYVAAANKLRREEPVGGEADDLQSKVRELEAQLAALGAVPVAAPVTKLQRTQRSTKRYQLLDTNVSWGTADQIHAIMAIVEAHVKVGEIFEEEAMISALEANSGVLQTTQGARKVWNYYKGNHARGLELHGNIKEV
jgi:hypothetical protein